MSIGSSAYVVEMTEAFNFDLGCLDIWWGEIIA
jgi:D-arabinose 5-phosphate isomerase GutQ